MNLRVAIALPLLVVLACAKRVEDPARAPLPGTTTPQDNGPPLAVKKPHTVPSPNGDRDDPYYWLRDDERTNPEVLGYLTAENAWRDKVMAPHHAVEEALFAELIGRLAPNDTSVPYFDRGYWYYRRLEEGKEHPIYCRKKGTMEAAEEVLLDANAGAVGHEFYEVAARVVSNSGRLFAYSDDTVGRRQYVLHVKDTATGAVLPDTASNLDDDGVWANDDRTLLYVERDPTTLLGYRVMKHVLGETQDTVVYEEKDKSFYVNLSKSKSGAYIFIDLHATTMSETLYADASDPALAFKPVLPRSADHEYQVEHVGRDFIVRTNSKGSTNFRIARVPVTQSTSLSAWKDVVPARADTFIEGFDVLGNAIAVNHRQDGLLKVAITPLTPKLKPVTVSADQPSYTMILVPTPELDRGKFRYVYQSLTTPPTTFDVDVKTGAKEELKRERVPGYDPTQYATEYLRANARDGTAVPVSIAYRKDTPRDGSAPLFQYGYGAYGLSIDPEFERDWVSLMDRGFVVAIAHIRGGQELGRAWYEGGKLLNKKNSSTDFIDTTHVLVEHGYAARGKVFAEGRSAGGIIMGAIANMAPDDYRAICAEVPFVDVVTTMLDTSIPLTTNEMDEWGNPATKDYYAYMVSYSPYDNVRAQAYPAMLVVTGLWDSQVQYYEPAKWVAKLRAVKTDQNPLVFSVDMAAGHGGKSGRFEAKRDRAREYAFFLAQLAEKP
ncbi:MAG: S9 family peptidase [Myxococcota bacterium]